MPASRSVHDVRPSRRHNGRNATTDTSIRRQVPVVGNMLDGDAIL